MKYHPRVYKIVLTLSIAAFVGVISLSVIVIRDVFNDRDEACELIQKARADNRRLWLRFADALEERENVDGAAIVQSWLDEDLPPIACIDGQPVERSET